MSLGAEGPGQVESDFTSPRRSLKRILPETHRIAEISQLGIKYAQVRFSFHQVGLQRKCFVIHLPCLGLVSLFLFDKPKCVLNGWIVRELRRNLLKEPPRLRFGFAHSAIYQ